MSRYSLRACWNGVKTNAVKALLFTPKPVGKAGLPLVVYLPGRGEIGDVARQFRQRTIFDLVTSDGFQKRHPCFLLALSPPESATTLLGGSPGRPTAVQRALHEFVLSVCRQSGKPKIDTSRVYLTGFSYGGNGVYALALNFPGFYAAAIPIAALPPVAESVSDAAPGSWWHFYNEGDYARHEMNAKTLRAFASAVGERWSRMGMFSGRDGVCSFVTRGAVRFVRVRSASERPQTFRLRRIDVVPSP